MNQSLTVTGIQTNLFWEDPEQNLSHFSSLLEELTTSDLIILPEMFTTGFSMKPAQLSEKMDGRSINWMLTLAKKKDAVVCGSLIIEEDGKFYNRLIWAEPSGVIKSYDKRHLFSYGGEDKVFTTGTETTIFNLKGWNINPFICYDLRFPVWSRGGVAADLILYTANWPAARIYHWRHLLIARAIENLSYSIGVNRTGLDGLNTPHTGNSLIADYGGKVLYETTKATDVFTVTLEKEPLETYRNRFNFHLDADKFTVQT